MYEYRMARMVLKAVQNGGRVVGRQRVGCMVCVKVTYL